MAVDETSSFLSSRQRRHPQSALLAAVSFAVLCGTVTLVAFNHRGGPVELEWKALAPGSVHSVTPKVTPKAQQQSKRLTNLQHLFGIQHFPGHGLATSHPHVLVPSLKKEPRLQELTDGYMDAGAYLESLQSNAVKQQQDHMKKWKAKNLKAGEKMVKDAAALYKKWVMVDPYTGISKPNLEIPDAPDAETAVARSPAQNQMLMQVTGADNGKTYTLPWFCIGVHPEADGSGQGWDGAEAPMGPHGVRGVDCTPPWLKAAPAATQLLAQVPVQRLTAEEGEEAGADEPIGDMIDALGGNEEEEAEEAEEQEEEREEAEAAVEAEEEAASKKHVELGEEVFEVDDGDGDVMMDASKLQPWIFDLGR